MCDLVFFFVLPVFFFVMLAFSFAMPVFFFVMLVVGCALRIPKHKYQTEKHKKHKHHNNSNNSLSLMLSAAPGALPRDPSEGG